MTEPTVYEFDRAINAAADRAAVLFRTFRWTWATSRDDNYIPTSEQIAKALQQLAAPAIAGAVRTGKDNKVGSGRLEVVAGWEDEEHTALGLTILIEIGEMRISAAEE